MEPSHADRATASLCSATDRVPAPRPDPAPDRPTRCASHRWERHDTDGRGAASRGAARRGAGPRRVWWRGPPRADTAGRRGPLDAGRRWTPRRRRRSPRRAAPARRGQRTGDAPQSPDVLRFVEAQRTGLGPQNAWGPHRGGDRCSLSLERSSRGTRRRRCRARPAPARTADSLQGSATKDGRARGNRGLRAASEMLQSLRRGGSRALTDARRGAPRGRRHPRRRR
jgi:hypothetical protein